LKTLKTYYFKAKKKFKFFKKYFPTAMPNALVISVNHILWVHENPWWGKSSTTNKVGISISHTWQHLNGPTKIRKG
jgi:hypothetical protein